MARKKKIKKVIRAAGPNISRSEMKDIVKAAGGNVTRAINRIASVQQSMKAADKVAPSVASGAANMLIRQAEKAPAFRQPDFGTSKLGQTLQSMVARPGTPGAMIKGQRVGGTAAQPGFNPGGRPDKNRMIGGTVIRPGGSIAVKKQPVQAAIGDQLGGGNEPGGGDQPGGGQPGTTGLTMDDILNALGQFGDSFTMPEFQMPDFSGMFDQLSAQYDTPDPIQLAALGQAYGGDMLRARQRQRKTRADYLRGPMGLIGGGLSPLAPLMIGGGVTL